MSRSVSLLIAASVMTIMGLTIAVVAYAAQNGVGPGQTKITLCHKGKKAITVGEPAVAAHMRHGDDEGACNLAESRTAPMEESTMMTEPTTVLEPTMMTEPTTSVAEIGEAAKPAGRTKHIDNTDGTNHSDQIAGGAGGDVIKGLLGGDELYGDSAADRLHGSPNDDFLQGGRGPDRMFGGANKDYLDGVDGIAGNDKLDGGRGTDHCVGDVGDTFEDCEGNVVKVPVPSESAPPTEASN